MPNINSPTGLKPVSSLGQTYQGRVTIYAVPASDGTALFIGDPVKLTGTSSIVNGVAYPNVIQAASGDVMVGVMTGTVADNRDSLLYRAASTLRLIEVADDPNLIFEVQQVTGGTPLTANDVGLNANLSIGTGSTVTGFSGCTIDNSTEATTNTLDVKILGMVNRADNDIGTSVSSGMDASRFLVRLNRHQYVNQIAGV